MDKKTMLQSIKEKFTAMADKLGLDAKITELSNTEKLIAFKKGNEDLKPEKFEDVLLNDGVTTVTIEPAVEAGAAIVIVDSEGNPVAAPAGEYILQDGRTVVVEEPGVVMEVRDAQVEEVEEPMKEESTTGVNPKQVIERIETEKIFSRLAEVEKTVKFLKEENEILKSELVQAQKDNVEIFSKLLSEPSQEPVVKKKITTIQEFSKSDEDSVLDKWLAKHNKK